MIFWKESVMEKSLIKKIAEIAIGGLYKDLNKKDRKRLIKMISAIILAAGLSKRMKLGNKLLLEKNNVPIIKTTLERVAASKVNEIIVVLGKDSSLIKNKVNDKRVKCITNKDYRSGISSSIKKGLKKVNKDNIGAMICLADMPLIKTSTYNQIIHSYYQNNRKI